MPHVSSDGYQRSELGLGNKSFVAQASGLSTPRANSNMWHWLFYKSFLVSLGSSQIGIYWPSALFYILVPKLFFKIASRTISRYLGERSFFR